ncbi:MAG: hypothetical protein GQ477_03080 [Nanohaloarchaea archaeon]|nr:hypothetical protein [Candidatus Nanohaloarchaea archaeon]
MICLGDGKMQKCPKCKEEIDKDDKFCKECGAKIVHAKKPKKKKIQMNYKIITPVAIILILIIIFFMFPKSQCGNNICDSGEDSTTCCMDCSCSNGYSCDGTSCKKLAQCGNGIIEEGETTDNCCIDVGCSFGKTCKDNTCIELKPEIGASFLQTSKSNSVTYLKAVGNDIGILTLTNTGNDDASNVKVTLSSPNNYFSDRTITFGTLNKNEQVQRTVDLTFLNNALDVTTNEKITIKAVISLSNSVNKEYNTDENFDMFISGRNYITWNEPEMIASWVTPTQPTIREFAAKATDGLPAGMDTSSTTVQLMAARWLFKTMRSYGVNYVNDVHTDGDYIQFPYETLKNKAGDCDDNAILYASLLEAIGLKSFLMLVPGHIFAGYIDSDGYAVPIETTSNDFDNALLSGISQYEKYAEQYDMIIPSSLWKSYPSVNLPESVQLNMPSITKQISDCELDFNLIDYWVASTNVQFVNSGNAPGAGCAAVATYENNNLKDQQYGCWTLNPGETKNVVFQLDVSITNIDNTGCSSY